MNIPAHYIQQFSIQCEHCKEEKRVFWCSLIDYPQHLAVIHHQSIQEQAIRSLETTKDKVEYLLRNIVATRSSDKLLYSYILRYSAFLVYNDATKKLEPRNREGWTFEDWLNFPSYETTRRSRQYLQAHYPELKASNKVLAIRLEKERAYHDHFASLASEESL
ncbi:MAG: hypothetical protein KGH64_04520 [Candidatus Micrarchaeota archaeon]|nr:hypothetical protein [Candidatus Micrarchaeota archaeon]